MKLIGCMLARNEEHEIGLSARVALEWCDELVVMVHASTDRTFEVIMNLGVEFEGRVLVGIEPNGKWDEMAHRQRMLVAARERGATHVAIVDADEILTGNILGTIRPQIERLNPGAMLRLPGYNLRGSLTRYHTNGVWGDRTFSFAFPDRPELGWYGDTFHRREPWIEGRHPNEAFTERPIWRGAMREPAGVMHLWGVSERRLKAKHILYRLTETLRWPNKSRAEIETMYSWAAKGMGGLDVPENWRFAEAPESWWAPYKERGWMQYLDPEAEPWQEAECQRIIAEHGRERFKGLTID